MWRLVAGRSSPCSDSPGPESKIRVSRAAEAREARGGQTCGKNEAAWARGCCREETRLDTVTGTCWVLLVFCMLATGTVGKLADSGKLMLLLISW